MKAEEFRALVEQLSDLERGAARGVDGGTGGQGLGERGGGSERDAVRGGAVLRSLRFGAWGSANGLKRKRARKSF